jgi:hypothetical protein
MGDRFTAVAPYSGSATSSYVKGCTVTANYTGTVSRIALNKTRYVAIFEGDGPAVDAMPTEADSGSGFQFNWAYLLVPLGLIALAGGGMGTAVVLKRRHESEEEAE